MLNTKAHPTSEKDAESNITSSSEQHNLGRRQLNITSLSRSSSVLAPDDFQILWEFENSPLTLLQDPGAEHNLAPFQHSIFQHSQKSCLLQLIFDLE